MVNYRRARIPGATYFITVTLKERKSDLLIRRIDLLRSAFRAVRMQNPFRIDAIVILPEGDDNFPLRWQALKANFTRAITSQSETTTRNARGEYNVWQSRYWEHLVRDDADFERHVNYIHYNPVKHSLATRPTDWRWSSVHRFIRLGSIPATWAVDPGEGGYGE